MKKTFKFLAIALSIGLMAFSTKNNKTFTVVIDAGHGGKDYGAMVNSDSEKAITERVAKQIATLNQDENVVIHFTRNDDNFVSLEERTKQINNLKPDLVVSIHVSANASEAPSGMEFYVYEENNFSEKSKEFASKIEQKFVSNNYKSRGVKKAPFYILKKSEAPSVLVELGFLSNTNDYKYLTNKAEQDKIASIILDFIKENK
ncbi:N-acetylmuramoyl-L-alanine amidase [Flavobacterium sp. NST-5]|uniref:N-acetylmuramoyl-L-alanine amidase n=1 Tax=Flavobacterium ichthyis TaxID=2698827 RepID=A0ABW9ZAV9_9FLAO|nr:N-acetylmuramoyl-L-alanine amidase [Flavobacterium ichthyis]NBL66036.1 N-acetylmuramoyl-L-alanine amidase [Flavobacterium ichthyis]